MPNPGRSGGQPLGKQAAQAKSAPKRTIRPPTSGWLAQNETSGALVAWARRQAVDQAQTVVEAPGMFMGEQLVKEALEVGTDALLSEARVVVTSGFGEAPSTRSLEQFQDELCELLGEAQSVVEPIVVLQTKLLIEQTREAHTEWQLARMLGPRDRKAEEALARARWAVAAEGAALLRTVQRCLRE